MEERLLRLMGMAFGVDLSAAVIADCTPNTVAGWDSLAMLNLVSLIEDEFGIAIDIDEIAAMTNGGAAVLRVVADKVKQ
jgi:acyl carrier protein